MCGILFLEHYWKLSLQVCGCQSQFKGHRGARLLHWKGLGVIDSSLFLNSFCVAYFKEENIMHLISLNSLHL
jgi:hypothetical protein